MAKIPEFGERPSPRFGGVVRLPEQGQAKARAISALGADIAGFGEIMAKEKIKDDKFKVEDATTRLQQRMLDLSKGEDGFTHVKAGNINNTFHEEQMARFDASRKEIEDSLVDDDQKAMFARRADLSRVGYGENLINHITRENNVFNGQVYEGGIATEIDLASTNYNNENEVKRALLRTRKLTEAEADRIGLKGDARKALIRENESNVHVEVIAQAVDDGNYQYAKDWFKENQKYIEGDKQDDVKRLLKTSGVKATSQEAVDSYIDRNLTEAEARDEARKLDPDIRDATLDRITARYSEASQMLDRKQKLFGEEARNIYASMMDQTGSAEDAYDSIPDTILNGMDGGERMALQNRAKLDAKNEDYPNGGADYYRLKIMARDNPKEFQKSNPFLFKLSETDRKEIIKLQTDEKELAISRTKTQIMRSGAINAGVSEKQAKQGYGEEVEAYFSRFDEELAALQEETGKEPTNKDMSEIADRLSIEVIRDPTAFFFKGKRPAIEAEIDGVPSDMIDDLAAALYNTGTPVTDQNIQHLYKRLQQ